MSGAMTLQSCQPFFWKFSLYSSQVIGSPWRPVFSMMSRFSIRVGHLLSSGPH